MNQVFHEQPPARLPLVPAREEWMKMTPTQISEKEEELMLAYNQWEEEIPEKKIKEKGTETEIKAIYSSQLGLFLSCEADRLRFRDKDGTRLRFLEESEGLVLNLRERAKQAEEKNKQLKEKIKQIEEKNKQIEEKFKQAEVKTLEASEEMRKEKQRADDAEEKNQKLQEENRKLQESLKKQKIDPKKMSF